MLGWWSWAARHLLTAMGLCDTAGMVVLQVVY